MHAFQSLIAVLGALALGTVSPGPSFVFVARTSVAGSRAQGVAAALGMGIGGVVFAALAMLGLQAFLTGVPWLYLSLKLLGGLYLIYLAVGIFSGAKLPLGDAREGKKIPSGARRAFLRGLLTQLTNPKAAVIYGSIFAALLPHDLPRAGALLLLAAVFVLEGGWYVVVALALSSPVPRVAYLRWKTPIDRVAGTVLGLLGIKLVASTDLIH